VSYINALKDKKLID
jgi:hypothetical protein